MFPIEKSPKISAKFYCEKCNYKCCKQSEYNKHILTNKHKILQNPTLDIVGMKKYECNCGKIYKHSSTLYTHKKICKINTNENINIVSESSDKELIMLLIQENSELRNMMIDHQNMMMEVIKNGIHNTTNHTNSHNKAFNLNFFLNETCKNAMNINDFVDSIQLKLSDLERVGDVGFVKGISDIIVDKLNALDVTVRPIHCTDQKREVLYVKDEDKWEKEDQENNKVRKVVKKVAAKNTKILKDFKDKHPDCVKSISSFSDRYNKLTIEAYGGIGNDFRENENKIIKNISKAIPIEKE